MFVVTLRELFCGSGADNEVVGKYAEPELAAEFMLILPGRPMEWELESVTVPGNPPIALDHTERAIEMVLKSGHLVCVEYKLTSVAIEAHEQPEVAQQAEVVYMARHWPMKMTVSVELEGSGNGTAELTFPQNTLGYALDHSAPMQNLSDRYKFYLVEGERKTEIGRNYRFEEDAKVVGKKNQED